MPLAYNLLDPLQGSFGPFGPEIPKQVEKKFPGPRGQERLKKSPKNVEKVGKRLFLTRF